MLTNDKNTERILFCFSKSEICVSRFFFIHHLRKEIEKWLLEALMKL